MLVLGEVSLILAEILAMDPASVLEFYVVIRPVVIGERLFPWPFW